VDGSDLLIIAFPLYVDSLPSRLVASLELIADHNGTRKVARKQKLMAIVNSGFPETRQNDTALAICRRFAEEVGFEWVGGLALGGRGTIPGRPLQEVGGAARSAIKALDITASAIAENDPVPKEAVSLIAKPIIPSWLYVWIANRGWTQRMKEYGTLSRLYDRPYLLNS